MKTCEGCTLSWADLVELVWTSVMGLSCENEQGPEVVPLINIPEKKKSHQPTFARKKLCQWTGLIEDIQYCILLDLKICLYYP